MSQERAAKTSKSINSFVLMKLFKGKVYFPFSLSVSFLSPDAHFFQNRKSTDFQSVLGDNVRMIKFFSERLVVDFRSCKRFT